MAMTSGESYDDDLEVLELDRFRHGLCPHCGVTCYKILKDNEPRKEGDIGNRRPLTVEGQVDNGRCIECQGLSPLSLTESPGLLSNNCHNFHDDCEDAEAFVEEPSNGTEEQLDTFDDCSSAKGGYSKSNCSAGSGAYSYRGNSTVRTPSYYTANMSMSDSRSMISDDDFSSSLASSNASVTKCMKELARQPPINEKRCFQIITYLYNISLKDKDQRVAAMSLGAAAGVSIAMSNHRNSVRVQTRACALLGVLADRNEEYQELIYNAGGVPNLVACMMSYMRGHKLLQQEATKALYILTELPKNADQFAMSQGIKIIKSVMQNYASDQAIQENACGILYHVAQVQVEGVANPELIEVIVTTLGRHKKAKRVHANGCSVFRVLAQRGSQKTRNSMVWADVVPHVLKCMKNNLSSDVVQIEACNTISALAEDRREVRVAVAEEGLGIIFDAMKKHETNLKVQLAACQLLLFVAEGPTSSFLAKAMKKYSGKKILECTKRTFDEPCGKMVNQILKCYL